MSNNISNVFISQFDADVKQAYQGEMKLSDTIRKKTGVIGKTYNFPKIGKGLATPRIPQADVTPINIQYTQNAATLTDWNAAEYTDIFNNSKVNFDDRAELVKAVSYAIGRRMDQIIIDELITGAASTVDEDLETPGYPSAFSLAKLLRAKRLLDEQGVPMEERYFVHSAVALENALNVTEFTSADYNTLRALVRGELGSYAGFKFIMVEDRAEGGLPIDGYDIRTNLAFHKQAAGLAVGMDMNTKIDWVPEKTSWLVNAMFSAGAKTIDSVGIVKVNALEA